MKHVSPNQFIKFLLLQDVLGNVGARGEAQLILRELNDRSDQGTGGNKVPFQEETF